MRTNSAHPALYYALVAALLVSSFQVWRAILLVMTSDMAASVPGAIVAQSFLVGARFDLAVTGYIMLPLIVLGMLPGIDIARSRVVRTINFWLLCVMVAVVYFVHLADIEFFKFFNVRLNGTANLWTDSPNIMFSMIWETYPVVWYLLMYSFLLAVFVFIARELRRWLIDHREPKSIVTVSFYALILIAVTALAIRGRIEEKSPLRWGVAFFSEYAYANQLALSPAYTYFNDLIYSAGSRERVEDLMQSIADPQAEGRTRTLLDLHTPPTPPNRPRIVRDVTYNPENPDPPNVIVVIMESFGASLIGTMENRIPLDLSPCFDSLSEHGILFTNIYSVGMHTYTGIFGTLYGYPAGFGNAVMKRGLGRNHHWGLPHILREHGYNTTFYTTSDPHFDNMQGFLMANGIERVSSLFDYDASEKLSTMGVPDHVMFDRAVNELSQQTDSPYLAVVLSASNHGPWIIPDVPMEPLPDTVDRYRERMAFKYSDWALGRFIEKLESDPAFDNTLVVVTSDNGLAYQPVTDLDLSQYHIPLLLYWIGSDRPAPQRIARLGSQMDIVATVMGQVGLSYDNFTFGHDLLEKTPTRIPFAFFSEWYKIGYIEDDLFATVRIDGPTSLYRLAAPAIDIADSTPQSAEDYRRKALAIYQTSYWNMQRPLRDTNDAP